VAHVEGVVHGSRRMVGGNIEGFEIVIVVFDLRPFGDVVADTGEEGRDPRQGAGYRVQAALLQRPPRQGHIDGVRRQLFRDAAILKVLAAGVEVILDLLLGPVDQRPRRGTLFTGKLAQALEQIGEHALLAQVFHPHLVQLGNIRRGFHSPDGLLCEGRQIFHYDSFKLNSVCCCYKENRERAGALSLLFCTLKQYLCYQYILPVLWLFPVRPPGPAYARAAFAWATIAPKAGLSCTARSDRTLRSSSIPAFFRPAINLL